MGMNVDEVGIWPLEIEALILSNVPGLARG
jgi:hypothetical protein